MGSSPSSISSHSDLAAFKHIAQQEVNVLNQLVDIHQISRSHALASIRAIRDIQIGNLTTEQCLRWIELNPEEYEHQNHSHTRRQPTTTPISRSPSSAFRSKESIASDLSQQFNKTFVPLRTNGNGNCLFNALVLCLRHCRSTELIHQFHSLFFAPVLQARNIYEDEIKAGLQVRLTTADLLSQDWTQSGIASDPTLMSKEGRQRNATNDKPMVDAQIDRLRCIDLNAVGVISCAWGDATDDLMSLCKIMTNATATQHNDSIPVLKIKVYVGTLTPVSSITGTWLDIQHTHSTSDSNSDSDSNSTTVYIYASGSHFTALVELDPAGPTNYEQYEIQVATEQSIVLRSTTAHTASAAHPQIHGNDHFESSEIHAALLAEQNKRRAQAQKRQLEHRLGQRRLKNKKKMIAGLQQTEVFQGIDDAVASQLLNAMELFYFDMGSTICLQGQRARNCMLVLQGEVSIFQRPRLGARPKLISKVGPMSLLGEVSLTKAKQYRGATLMATGDVVVQALVLSKRDFLNLTKQNLIPDSVLETIAGRVKNNKDRDIGRRASCLLVDNLLKKKKKKKSKDLQGAALNSTLPTDCVQFQKPNGTMMSSSEFVDDGHKKAVMSQEDQQMIVKQVQERLSFDAAHSTFQQHEETQKEVQKKLEEKRKISTHKIEKRLLARLERKRAAQFKVAAQSLVLRQLSIFQDLSAEHLVHLIRCTKHAKYAKNEVICKVGDVSDRLFVLTKGQVLVQEIQMKEVLGGAETTHDKGEDKILNAVCVLGETALMEDDNGTRMTRTATCVANSKDVEVLTLSRSDFFNCCKLMDESIGKEMLANLRSEAMQVYKWD